MLEVGGSHLLQDDAENDATEDGVEPPAPAASDRLSPSLSDGRKSKLILHVDLNETILASDEALGRRTVASLDCFLASNTWGTVKHGKWEWLSDAPSLHPPCGGAVTYHSHHRQVHKFTSNAGKRFRGILDEHLRLLRWPEGVKEDRELCMKAEDGHLYHWILPSFFQLLQDLVREGRDFAVVFRTFGVDLPRVLSALSRSVLEGAHPLFPDLPDLKEQLRVNPAQGKIRCSPKGIAVTRGEERVSSRDGDRSLYQYFSSAEGLGGFQDDYNWWCMNRSTGGKPLWVDPFDQDVQHIFLDDNIRLSDKDSVVNTKVFTDPGGSDTREASVPELYDITLIQMDLLQAISDPHYFTKRIHICEENYARNLQQVA
ncbi:uncharacterized protein ACB058_019148 isoform 1-T1 [Synchiropus picturatus]